MDFHEILHVHRAAVWPSYILVTISITIRIWKSDHDSDPGRAATLSTHTEQMPSVQPASRVMLAFGGGLCSLSTSSFDKQSKAFFQSHSSL